MAFLPSQLCSPKEPIFRCASAATLAFLALTNLTPGNDMPPESFAQYAKSKELNSDQTFTVELLIEDARREFDPDYWDNWEERSDAWEEKGYTPSFSQDQVEPAWAELEKLEWLSLQRLRGHRRPLRDVGAVRYLTKLTGLVLIDNEVVDISPLGALVNLKRLHLANNPIKCLSPLSTCLKIEELDIRGVPAEDLSVLQSLPKLRELEISIDQVATLEKLDELPALERLDIGIGDIDSFTSFERFPEMPQLREVRGADVSNLKGLERYPKLQQLTNLSGSFD
ncbi:MAG: leucine-rich repeat domain-containing protein [Verrucomicrobiales bacterium]